MNWFMVTLMGERKYGDAILSWYKAVNQFKRVCPAGRLMRVELEGNPVVDEVGLGRHKDDYGHEVVTRKYIEARELFLKTDCDVFIAVEDDMVLPVDALVRLKNVLDGGADVAYGLYTWRHGLFSNRRNHWSAYEKMEGDYGWSISLNEVRAREAFEAGAVVDVVGVGLGCTAIRRAVLETIRFERRGLACNDWYFAQDCVEHGFVQRCDFGLVCGHYAVEPSPRLLFPDPGETGLRRTVLLNPEVS